MKISARVDYGVRTMLELAARQDIGEPVSTVDLATVQAIPVKFLEAILTTLRKANLLVSVRGSGGGFILAKPAADITIAEIIRALDGPLASIHGLAPEDATYEGSAAHLRDVWVALRVSMRDVLESVSLSDIANNTMPDAVTERLVRDGAWERRLSERSGKDFPNPTNKS
jgi:Rrf2 family protein